MNTFRNLHLTTVSASIPVSLTSPPTDYVCTAEESFKDDDDDLLESLSGDESVSSWLTEPSVNAPHDALLLLFSAFEKIDILALFNQYYTKKGVKSTKNLFAFSPSVKGGDTSWRCTFTCPLSGNTYYAGLPRNLLVNQDECEELCRKVTTLFGQYNVTEEYVFFSTKRGAKKSVALQVLQACKATGVTCEGQFLYHSVVEASTSRPVQLTKPAKSPPRRKLKRMVGRYPRWVMELCDIGIDASSLSCSFREFLPRNKKRQNSSFSEPTMLCCVMSIIAPIILTVVGLPSQSKGDAIESAVTLLIEEIRRQLKGKEDCGNYLSKYEPIAFADMMEMVFALVWKSTASYVYPLPPWATTPFPTIDESASISGHGTDGVRWPTDFSLYELEFLTSSGDPLTRMGIDKNCTTPLGIVFARDPTEIPTPCAGAFETNDLQSVSYQATFYLPSKFKGKEEQNIRVILKNRSPVTMGELRMEEDVDGWIKRLSWMRHFNFVINDGKNYVFGKKSRRVDTSRYSAEDMSTSNCLLNRTYMFVPLNMPTPSSPNQSAAIDWTMLRNVAENTTTPQSLLVERKPCLPWVGEIDLRIIGMAVGLADLVLLSPHVFNWIEALHAKSDSALTELLRWEIALCLALAMVSAVCLFCGYIILPKQILTSAALANRFLFDTSGRGLDLFVLRSNEDDTNLPLTTKFFDDKSVLSDDSLSLSKKKTSARGDHQERKLDLTLRRIRGFRSSKNKLLEVYKVKMHTDYDMLSVASNHFITCKEVFFIAPKSLQVLPMPRDVLWLCRHANRFMPPLERAIEIASLQRRMILMGHRVRFAMHHSARPSVCLADSPAMNCQAPEVSLASLLDEATTMTPFATYHRLEFLGDAVLSFFLAINAMALNSSLQWDYYDLALILSDAGSSKALFNAALRIGASRFAKKGARQWLSAYQQCSEKDRTPQHARELSIVQLQYKDVHHTAPLEDKTLSDIVESVLAAAFIAGRNSAYGCDCGSLVIGLLGELQLPFPEVEGKRVETGWPWFRSMGRNACLTQGYNFALDREWQKILVKLGTVLYCKHEVIDSLESSWRSSVEMLSDLASMKTILKALETQSSKILLMGALFDQSFPDELSKAQLTRSESALTDDSVKISSEDESEVWSYGNTEADGLYRLALLRDTLFHVGSNSLRLFVSDYIFQRYPHASEGDLSFLRSCATSDDVVVYVMITAGFHEFLYDQEAPALSLFRKKLLVADAIGADIWKKRGGWIVDGGIAEFRRRCRFKIIQDPLPRYCGLAGGRLHGCPRKLPDEITEDLSFSMKSIIGALVLSLGLEGMQCCIGPLFEETMLLSVEELREAYKETSTICGGN